MANDAQFLRNLADRLTAGKDLAELHQKLTPKPGARRENLGAGIATVQAVEKRWAMIGRDPGPLADAHDPKLFAANCENYLGTVKMPLGLAGPLRVNGLHAQGDYWLPLATHEAALVASYHRGAQLLGEAGGCTALLLAEGVTRSPGFAFATVAEAGRFLLWALQEIEAFRAVAATTTRHGRLEQMRVSAEGNHVYLLFDYSTGDAAGQNMVTIATQAVCDDIIARSPVKPAYWYVEANASGDKKASAQSFAGVRGKKVSAEAIIPAALLERRLHATARQMVDYWRMSALGGVISGTIGVHGHYANGLAALFIACGQDAACVSEAAVGVTRFEDRDDGALYAAVTLPNLIVGTVGGGTSLPSQRACLEVMGLSGQGHARAFAEVCASTALAGELSIIGALASGQFTRAHQRLARDRRAANQGTPAPASEAAPPDAPHG
jgi:hydroxymethylglutaryl-CoA reductase (NADPH)